MNELNFLKKANQELLTTNRKLLRAIYDPSNTLEKKRLELIDYVEQLENLRIEIINRAKELEG